MIIDTLDLDDVIQRSQDWVALCEPEARRLGTRFHALERADQQASAALPDSLNPAQRALAIAAENASTTRELVEQRAAFELGRDFGTAASARRPALERFRAAAQTAYRLAPNAQDEDHDILREAVQELGRAIPVARQQLLISRPLDSVSNALSAYVAVRVAEGISSDHAQGIARDEHDTEHPGAEREAVYAVGVAVGLLLSEVL